MTSSTASENVTAYGVTQAGVPVDEEFATALVELSALTEAKIAGVEPRA
jgi:hypothetical protein